MNLEMRGIYKSFGANDVLKNVDFSLNGGEICALLGENGAGKSTLMNQLYGLLKPTSGQILVNGKAIEMNNPRDAIAAGIGMVHPPRWHRLHPPGAEPHQRPGDL